MAKKDDFGQKLKGLGTRIKTEPVTTPIQEVRPVEPVKPVPEITETKKEAHVNFWVPDPLMVRLKVYAAKSGMTIKQIGVEALEQFLNANEK